MYYCAVSSNLFLRFPWKISFVDFFKNLESINVFGSVQTSIKVRAAIQKI